MPTINDWNIETRSLLQRLHNAGIAILSVSHEDRVPFDANKLDQFIEECSACDESYLSVRLPDDKKATLMLVYGNSPGELVADYTSHPLLDVVTQEHYAEWDGKPQPVKQVD